jgi:NAD(P)-dependent dehydrogenase (short-subunit alcohol dehydrogenase family)
MVRDKTAFVTGASQGIGRQIAITLAEEGANVALAARSDGIYETDELIESDDTLAIETDVSDETSVEESIAETVDTFGGLDILVNNAGIAGPTAPVEEVTMDEWQQTIDVNLTGMFLAVKHAAQHLREGEASSVVNISSISGKRPLESRTPYTASKMGVIGLTRTLAFELGDDDVNVNAICPGAVKGERIRNVIEKQAEQLGLSYEEAKREVITDGQALDEIIDPEDIADMVVYLASDSGRHITAQDISVDSGATWY